LFFSLCYPCLWVSWFLELCSLIIYYCNFIFIPCFIYSFCRIVWLISHWLFSWVLTIIGFVAISTTTITSHSVTMCSNMSNMIVVPIYYTVVEPTNLFSFMMPTIQGFMTIFITRKTKPLKKISYLLWFIHEGVSLMNLIWGMWITFECLPWSDLLNFVAFLLFFEREEPESHLLSLFTNEGVVSDLSSSFKTEGTVPNLFSPFTNEAPASDLLGVLIYSLLYPRPNLSFGDLWLSKISSRVMELFKKLIWVSEFSTFFLRFTTFSSIS